MGQRLAVVAARGEASRGKDIRHLQAKQWDVTRAAVVSDRGEEPDEKPLAGHLAAVVENLDGDGIQVGRAVNGGALVRFGDAQQLGRFDEVLHVGRQTAQIAQAIEDRHFAVGQDAQRGFSIDFRFGRLASALEAVFAVTQIGEVVVIKPFQEGQCFLHLGGGQLGRIKLQFAHQIAATLAHGQPIDYGRADIF